MANETVDVGVAYGDVETMDRVPLPDGTYPMEVTEVRIAESRNKNKLIRPVCKVLQLPKESPPKGADGEAQSWQDNQFPQFTITEASLWKLKQFCKAIGIKWSGTKIPTGMFVKKRFMGIVTSEMYDGKMRNRVDNFEPMAKA